MKKNKIINLILYIFLLSVYINVSAQEKKYSKEIYYAYINGNMDKWTEVITSLESSGTPTIDEKLELLEYYYAHVGYLIGSGQRKTAKNYIDKTEKLLDLILNDDPSNATALSVKGTFLGYKMEMNKLTAPVLGPQCMKYIKKAYSLDNGNVQAVSDLGHMYYHCPSLFGGDKTLGMDYIRKAIGLIEQNGNTNENWYYLNLLTILAQYEAESGSKHNALSIYEKVLALEPGFLWVRNELYPDLKKSL